MLVAWYRSLLSAAKRKSEAAQKLKMIPLWGIMLKLTQRLNCRMKKSIKINDILSVFWKYLTYWA